MLITTPPAVLLPHRLQDPQLALNGNPQSMGITNDRRKAAFPGSHSLAGAARLPQQRKPLSVPAAKAGQPRGSRKLRPLGRVVDMAGNFLPPSTFFALNPCAEVG